MKKEVNYTGSSVWIGHGLVLLRCAPEHLQHVSRDLKAVDEEINGPFSPDEFLKGKHLYQDLFGEKENIEEVATGDDDTAWLYDPNNMEMRKDESMETHEPGPEKRSRLNFKQSIRSEVIDRVVGQPSNGESGRTNQDAQQGEGESRNEGLQEHVPRAVGQDRSSQRDDTPARPTTSYGRRKEITASGWRIA
jgi:hypothetical protein